ncbi:MAG: 3-oxoacyl-[acyl-carrier-protein] synthase III C-terminal domain-containing protein [Planctomycetota bacterium]
MNQVHIIGTGMALPKRAVSNAELCQMFPALATSDEWLRRNVGVQQRYLADSSETLVEIMVQASTEAIEQAGVNKIDRIIVGSNTQATQYPTAAGYVAKSLNGKRDLSSCWCVDIQNGCPSGLAAIALAVDSIRTGQAETVLAIGGDFNSRMLDYFERNASLLMGDGASAFVLTRRENPGKGELSVSVLSHWEQTDYESADIMRMKSSLSDFSPYEVSRRTRSAALEAIKQINGDGPLSDNVSKEIQGKLEKINEDLRKIAFPPQGLPYEPDRYPHFIMLGAEVLEKIRRIVPDCGYLPMLRNAGIGKEIFESYDLLGVNRVSGIPGRIRKEVLKKLSDCFQLFIPHQANLRAHQNLSAALQIPMNRIYSNIAQYANTSAGAAGIALYESLRKPSRFETIRGCFEEIETPMFEPGFKAVLVSFGAGTHVVSMALERLK